MPNAAEPLPIQDTRLGFIGAGQMATALARGFIEAKLAVPEQILASDPSPAALKQFADLTGCQASPDNLQVVWDANCIFLAVKPQHVAGALGGLRDHLTAGQLVVSIVAGISLASLRKHVGDKVRLIRVMPNTPCLIGQGAIAYCRGPGATADDATLVSRLFGSVGSVHEVEEKHLDAVTGLSGSGPAFVYLMIEALSDGGVRMGLPRELALALSAQTVKGAAEMVLKTREHPAVLKDRVASPGGTTIAGLKALEAGGVRGDLMAAVEAATQRATELGRTS